MYHLIYLLGYDMCCINLSMQVTKEYMFSSELNARVYVGCIVRTLDKQELLLLNVTFWIEILNWMLNYQLSSGCGQNGWRIRIWKLREVELKCSIIHITALSLASEQSTILSERGVYSNMTTKMHTAVIL